jgi:hypothetical protein
MDIRIAGITWSLTGNCILMVREGHTATDLNPHAESVAHLLMKKAQQIKSINEDKPWPCIVIDSIDTGIQTWDENLSPYSMNHILTTLKTDNPSLTDIKLKEEPRWLCGHDTINTKRHSSLVITLKDKLAQKSILEHKFIFGWGHPM